jgi:hypothetical protein
MPNRSYARAGPVSTVARVLLGCDGAATPPRPRESVAGGGASLRRVSISRRLSFELAVHLVLAVLWTGGIAVMRK